MAKSFGVEQILKYAYSSSAETKHVNKRQRKSTRTRRQEIPSNTSAQATTTAKGKPKSAAFRHRNTRLPVKVDTAKLLERQIIWLPTASRAINSPDDSRLAVEKAKLQQPNWERYADKGEDWPSE